MVNNLKALVVVMFIALAVFHVAKPICLRFMLAEDFVRRRNVWCALTVTIFVSPSFWVYFFVALPLLIWCGRKDSNPVSVYLLMLHIVPPIGFYIPAVGINSLFPIDNYRLLSFAILIPTAFRLLKSPSPHQRSGLNLMDVLLLCYCFLQIVLVIPYEAFTNTLRRSFLLTVDVLVLYYVFSRAFSSKRHFVDAIATFCLSCSILAPLAFFESMRGWLLYQGIGDAWGTYIDYLMRGDSLRAQVSAGHALPLGYMLAVGFGCWLYLRQGIESKKVSWLMIGWIWMGLIAAYSRAPWLVGGVVFLVTVALGPQGMSNFVKALLLGAVVGALVLVSPMGGTVIDNLPFVGTVDSENVTYRQQLAEMSWILIKQNPLFGSPFVLEQMESLRQGQGIIDLVNTYATVALFYGLVGLFFFAGFFLLSVFGAFQRSRELRDSDPDFSLIGNTLVACLAGTLFMMATGSFGTGLAQMAWILAAIACNYAKLALVDPVRPPPFAPVMRRAGSFARPA